MVNPDISNGTCYSSANSESKGDFIPCGNVEFGNWPCCLAGNVCLDFGDANACWDHGTGNTYVAGCTDSNVSFLWFSPLKEQKVTYHLFEPRLENAHRLEVEPAEIS